MDVKPIGVRLLDLLDAKVGVDMLSGTSAGGINGALLGPARASRSSSSCSAGRSC
ncbi:hypothetical protein ACQ86D_38915 [Streptomyces galilaeus]